MIKDKITVRIETRFKELNEDHGTPFSTKCWKARELIKQVYQDRELCITENLIKRFHYLKNSAALSRTAYGTVLAGLFAAGIVLLVGNSRFGWVVSAAAGICLLGIFAFLFYRSLIQGQMEEDRYHTKQFELEIINGVLEKCIANHQPEGETEHQERLPELPEEKLSIELVKEGESKKKEEALLEQAE